MPAKKKTGKKTRKPAKRAAKATRGKTGKRQGALFGKLERSILMAKGVSAAAIKKMIAAGIRTREDFRTVGDAQTLGELTGLAREVAERVIAWAGGPVADSGKLLVGSGDLVTCAACGKVQPKDFKSGDLCVHCGKQAEPVFSCYWCSTRGPGKFCRSCGAAFVPPGELELAILLKRDGLPKEEIPRRLDSLSAAEKQALWGRVRARF